MVGIEYGDTEHDNGSHHWNEVDNNLCCKHKISLYAMINIKIEHPDEWET